MNRACLFAGALALTIASDPSAAAPADFDGDGRSDIVWRNSSTGENYLYPMNGTTIGAGEGYLRTVADGNWRMVGIGDFNGGGKADILWRNSSTGENYLYLMNGTAIEGEGYIRTVADQDWRVAGVADFDGDGKADILWRNYVTGENYLYLMNGLAIVGEGYLRTVANLDWRIAGVGDFNGGGKADILWRNFSTGENYIYLMNGTAIEGEGYIRTVAGANWQVTGIGDFDGGGKADILWRNFSTGENYIYLMNGAAIAGEGYIRTVADVAWRIVAIGDYDGDGKADILWRNVSTGDNYLYPLDAGPTIKPSEGYVRTVSDLAWKVSHGRLPPARADVVIAVDTTGSMGGEITNLKNALSTTIIPQLRATLPDIAFAVVDFRDFGDVGSWVVMLRQRVQTVSTSPGVAAIQNAVNALTAALGGDTPEAGWEAMYSIAGGPHIVVSVAPSTYDSQFALGGSPPAGESYGTIGGAGFRAGALPIVIAITDAEWHDAPGSGGANPYPDSYAGVPSRADAIARLNAIGAKVISVVSPSSGTGPKAQGQLLAQATNTIVPPSAWGGTRPAGCAVGQCCTGVNGAGEAVSAAAGSCPLVYSILDTGAGLGTAIVNGVQMLLSMPE